jgi:hypothetical protein
MIETAARIRISADSSEHRSGHRERLDFCTTGPDGIRGLLKDSDHLVAERQASAGIRRSQDRSQTQAIGGHRQSSFDIVGVPRDQLTGERK